MIATMPVASLLLATLAGLWFAFAGGATLIGARRSYKADKAVAEARAVSDLLAGSPALPLLVYRNDAIDADPRIAAWLGLDGVPERLAELDGEHGLSHEDHERLIGAIALARASSRPLRITIARQDGARIFSVSLESYSIAGEDERSAILLWWLDVTDLQQAKARLEDEVASLRKTVDGLSSLIEAAPFPMWQRGPDLRLALVNGAYVRATEAQDPAEVITRGLELLDGSSPSPRTSAAEARERQQMVVRTAPAIVDGERRMMRVADVPIGEAGVAGYANDIQDLEDARANLSLFVEAQHDMFDRLSAGVAQFAADQSLIFYNRQFLRLFGLETEWLADRPEFDRVLERMRDTRRIPESRDFPRWKAEHRQWFSITEPVEESWLLPGGNHLRVVGQPLPDRGLLLICEDRTEHLQLASARDTLVRVRTATFDSLFEAIGVFGADGRLNLWNARFRDVLGLPAEDMARQPRVDALVRAIGPRLSDPSCAALILDVVRTATVDRRNRAGRIAFVDGRHFDFAAVPLPDGNALFTLLDVTASRGMEEALRDRAEALEEADRLKSAFVANLSYELRVPLTSIAGFAEMLATGYAGEINGTAREYVDAILSGVSRLSGLTSDVLDLAQSVTGTLPMVMEPVDLCLLVSTATEHVRDVATNAEISLVVEAGSDAIVQGDRKRLYQAFDHLLRNAVAYTQPGGRVLVRSGMAGPDVEVIVSDNGPGIPPDKLDEIFARFARSTIDQDDGAAQGRTSGGFGLPLARQLVEAHGGTLEIVSDAGQGTSVIVRLPTFHPAAAAA
jgi:signal transduction histidine kinase